MGGHYIWRAPRLPGGDAARRVIIVREGAVFAGVRLVRGAPENAEAPLTSYGLTISARREELTPIDDAFAAKCRAEAAARIEERLRVAGGV